MSNQTAYNTGLLQGISYRILSEKLDSILAIYGLNAPEWKLLGQLYEYKNIKAASLAKILQVEPPLASVLLHSLIKKKLATRVESPTDARIKIVNITALGKKIIEELEPPIKQAMRLAIAGTTPEELAIYLKVLKVIVQNKLL